MKNSLELVYQWNNINSTHSTDFMSHCELSWHLCHVNTMTEHVFQQAQHVLTRNLLLKFNWKSLASITPTSWCFSKQINMQKFATSQACSQMEGWGGGEVTNYPMKLMKNSKLIGFPKTYFCHQPPLPSHHNTFQVNPFYSTATFNFYCHWWWRQMQRVSRKM